MIQNLIGEFSQLFLQNVPAHEARAKNASVSLVLRQNASDNKLKILFIKRSEREGDPWSGHMAFPGGRYDKSDENVLETAKRETFEEVGLDLSKAQFLGALTSYSPRINPDLTVHPFVFLVSEEQLNLDLEEVMEYHWVDLELAFQKKAFIQKIFQFKGQSITLPSFIFTEEVDRHVWGVTYVIFLEFLYALAKSSWGEKVKKEVGLGEEEMKNLWVLRPYK